jgi:hypothetical protein
MERPQRFWIIIPVRNYIKYLPSELGCLVAVMPALQPGAALVHSPFRCIEFRHHSGAVPYELDEFIVNSHFWTPSPSTASSGTVVTGSNA